MAEKQKPDQPRRREFAFSRIAGASPTEYAAISTTAVTALVIAMFSWLALLWVWGLLVPAAALVLSVLSLYYIGTSAGTLTGRKVAVAALMISLAVGGASGIAQIRAYRQQQIDLATVRALGQDACRYVQAGDFEGLYSQVAPGARGDVPMGYWRYEWTRFFDVRGRVARIELSPRTLTLPGNQILITMNVYVEDRFRRDSSGPTSRPAERAFPIRLIYARPIDLEKMARLAGIPIPVKSEPGEAEQWRLVSLQSFLTPLPPQYVQPLVWPAKPAAGSPQTEVFVMDQSGKVLPLPPGQPIRLASPQAATQPTTEFRHTVDGQLEDVEVVDPLGQQIPPPDPPMVDASGRPVVARIVLPPLVPPSPTGDPALAPWLPAVRSKNR